MFPYEDLAAAIPRERFTDKTLLAHHVSLRPGIKFDYVRSLINSEVTVVDASSGSVIETVSEILQETLIFDRRRLVASPAFPKWKGL